MVNRYNTFQPFNFDLYKPDVTFIGAVVEELQKRYDKNFSDAEALKNLNLPALDVDKERAKQIQAEWSSRVDNIVNSYGQDYAKATKDLHKLKQDLSNQLNYGEAGAIQQSYASYNDWKKRSLDRLAKGEITEQDFRSVNQYMLNNYGGVKLNDLTGAYDSLSPTEVAEAVDIRKDLTDALSKLKPRKIKVSEPVKMANGFITYQEVEKETVDPQEAQNLIAGLTTSSHKYVNLIAQRALVNGRDPKEELINNIEGLTKELSPAYSGLFTDNNTIKLETDPIYLKNLDYKYDLAKIRAKGDEDRKTKLMEHQLENPELIQGDNMSIIGVVSKKQMDKIDPSTGVLKKDSSSSPVTGGFMTTGTSMSYIGQKNEYAKEESLTPQQVLNEPEKYKDKVNIDLLGAAVKGEWAKYQRAKMQGKNVSPPTNKTYWEIYNNSLENDTSDSLLYSNEYRSQKQRDEAKNNIKARLNAGLISASVWDGTQGKFVTLSGDSVRDKLADDKLWEATGKADPASTGVIGETVRLKGGQVLFIHSDNERLNADQQSVIYNLAGYKKDGLQEGGVLSLSFITGNAEDSDKLIQSKRIYNYDPKEGRVKGKDRLIDPITNTVYTHASGLPIERSEIIGQLIDNPIYRVSYPRVKTVNEEEKYTNK